jgi:cytochrome c biogenesis protein CcmG/thiol:disulfide interchange protein DsbE
VIAARRPAEGRLALVAALLLSIALLWLAGCGPSTTVEIGKGKPVPNITGTTLDGAPFDLAALRGKPVLLNFWGPSCVPCRTEFPLLARKAAEHAGDGLVIVGVLTDDPVEPARAFATANGGTWPTVIDPGGAIKAAFRVLGRPQSYFVDRTGVLQSIQIGEILDADFERQYAAIAGGQ